MGSLWKETVQLQLCLGSKAKNQQLSGPDHVGGVDVRNMPLWPIHRTAGRRSPWPRLLLPLPMCQLASGRGRKSGVSSGMNGCVSAQEESIVLIWLSFNPERIEWESNDPPRQIKSRRFLRCRTKKKRLEKLLRKPINEEGGREGCASPRSHYHHSTKGQIYSVAFLRHKAD